MHGGKNCIATTALVPGRTITQCYKRWQGALNPSIGRANGPTGKWVEDEDIKLKDAVQTHGGNAWVAIATQIPGRTRMQCYYRWQNVSDCSIKQANGRMGTVAVAPIDPVTVAASLPNTGASCAPRCVCMDAGRSCKAD
jgi:hypothetical protein